LPGHLAPGGLRRVGIGLTRYRSKLRLCRRAVNAHGQRCALREQSLDLRAEAAPAPRDAEGLPGRGEPRDAFAKRVAVVLLVEEALLVLEVHVVPVRVLRDLPLAEATALLGCQVREGIDLLGVTELRELRDQWPDVIRLRRT